MSRPIFVKGNIQFSLDEISLKFNNKSISTYGATGLSWSPLDSQRHFGVRIMTDVTLNIPDPVQFTCESIIVREQSLSAEHMGIKFILTEKQQAELDALIGKYGYYPTEYIRKYPRIPTSPRIQTYPLQVIAQGIFKDLETPPIVMNIQNLSLGGLLGSSENPFTFSILPGQKLDLHFQPRGDFSIQITVQGTVCRVMEDIDPFSSNVLRMFGIKFSKVDEQNRASFLELLRDILTRMKDTQLTSPSP
jgi:hypothetical protein